MRYRWIVFGVVVSVLGILSGLMWHGPRSDIPSSQRAAYAQVDRDFSEECTTEVQRFNGTGETTTELFPIRTSFWRIAYTYPDAEVGVQLFISVFVENERGEDIASEPEFLAEEFPTFEEFLQEEQEAPTPEDEDANFQADIVESVPGQYRLDISPDSPDRPFEVIVYECGPPEQDVPAPEQPAQPTPSAPAPVAPAPSVDSDLLEAGGLAAGPMPLMLDGGCPREFPVKHGGGCNAE